MLHAGQADVTRCDSPGRSTAMGRSIMRGCRVCRMGGPAVRLTSNPTARVDCPLAIILRRTSDARNFLTAGAGGRKTPPRMEGRQASRSSVPSGVSCLLRCTPMEKGAPGRKATVDVGSSPALHQTRPFTRLSPWPIMACRSAHPTMRFRLAISA